MRKSSACILSLALLAATTAFAQTATTTTGTTATTTTTKTHHMACKMAHGEVANKDAAGNSFGIHPKKGDDVKFMVGDATKYTVDGKKATWAEIADGQTAVVWCKMDGTNKMATTVKAKTAKTPPAAH